MFNGPKRIKKTPTKRQEVKLQETAYIHNKNLPTNKKFYSDNIRASVTNSMSGVLEYSDVEGRFVEGSVVEGTFVEGSIVKCSVVEGRFVEGSVVECTFVEGCAAECGAV